jgi:hypothetical protein
VLSLYYVARHILLTSYIFKGNKMANQTFKVAGITTHNGNTKVRFTDDMIRRIKQFTKGGASRIDLVELPSEMTKVEALKYLQSHAEFQSPSDQATIADSLDDREKEASKGEVKVKSTKAKPSMANLKARAKKSSTQEVSAEQILAEVGVK